MRNTLRQRQGPLCWSQWPIWSYGLHGIHAPDLDLRLPVNPQLSPDRVERALQTVIARHESLRTTYEYAPDSLRPRQVVWDARAQLYDFQVVPAAVRQPYIWFNSRHIEGYDLATRWPIKVLFTTIPGRVSELCLRIHHLAIDFHGLRLLRKELGLLLGTSTSTNLSVVHRQPIDIALDEQSHGCRNSNKRAIEFHRMHESRIEELLKHNWRYATRRSAGSQSEYINRRATVSFSSGTAQRPIYATSKALRVSPAAVVTAGIASAFAQVLEYSDLIFGFIVSNRHLPGTQNTICQLAQVSLLPATIKRHGSFDDLAHDCGREIIRAEQHGHFHANQRALRESEIGHRSIVSRGLITLNLMIGDGSEFTRKEAPSIRQLRNRFEGRTREVLLATGGAEVKVLLNPHYLSIELHADARLLDEYDLKRLTSLIISQVGS